MTTPTIWARVVARVRDPASLRSWVVDANDGIIATAGVLEGFASAGADDHVLLIAALVATLAGGLAVGGAKWAEEAAERDAQLRLVREEEAQLQSDPEHEVDELADYWERKGLTPDVARQVAEQLSARDALAAQLESEHGIDQVASRLYPAWVGLTAGGAFILGAAVPLLITAVVPVRVESWAILAAVVVSLTLTSLVSARAGRLRLTRILTRTLLVGVGTLGVSYLAGLVLF